MKNLITTLLFLTTTVVFSQNYKTFTKQLTVQTSTIACDFSSEIVVKTTLGEPKINWTVQTNVGMSVLDALVKTGRYEVKVEEIKGVTVLRMPKIFTKIKIQDVEINEKISCEILLPESIILDKSPILLN